MHAGLGEWNLVRDGLALDAVKLTTWSCGMREGLKERWIRAIVARQDSFACQYWG